MVVLLFDLELLCAALELQGSIGVVTHICSSRGNFAIENEHSVRCSLQRSYSQSISRADMLVDCVVIQVLSHFAVKLAAE